MEKSFILLQGEKGSRGEAGIPGPIGLKVFMLHYKRDCAFNVR